MRIKSILAALAVLTAAFVAFPQSASAGFRHYYNYTDGDPYHYRYVQPGYYPYYDSHYWVKARCYRKARKHYKLPRYYKAWGYPKRCKAHHGCKPHHHHRSHWFRR